jgi:serine/threonine-protein kinase HipA
MKISGNSNLSQLKFCLEAAHRFLMSKEDALSIFEHIEGVIHKNWDEVSEEAQLSEVDRKHLWRRQFLNPFSFEE